MDTTPVTTFKVVPPPTHWQDTWLAPEPEPCPQCTTIMTYEHCKVCCPACGYFRDCTD